MRRRFFHVVSFFMFFFNIVVGLFAALRRILFGAVFGIFLIPRLDRCLLMRGVEKFDSGSSASALECYDSLFFYSVQNVYFFFSAFKCYLAMLQVDCTHNHPVMKAFVQLLWSLHEKNKLQALENGDVTDTSADFKRQSDLELVKVDELKDVVSENADAPKKRRSPKWRNKWWKAVTLYNNPSLTLELLKQDMQKSKMSAAEKRVSNCRYTLKRVNNKLFADNVHVHVHVDKP